MKRNAGGELPFVTVIVPMLDEERHIMRCLSSLLEQDYPHDRLEILVVDGGSTDGSPAIVREVAARQPRVRLMNNPGRLASAGLNVGVRHARGQVIVRLDAHCRAHADYVSECVGQLLHSGADNVGGVIQAEGEGFWGKAIAIGTTCPFGVGNSQHRCARRETRGEPGWPGAYWRQTLVDMGGFDESVGPNDDDDLSFRLVRAGRHLLLTPRIHVTYFCRNNLRALWKQYFRYGFFKVRLLRKHGRLIFARHLVPGAFVLALLLAILVAVVGFPIPLELLTSIYLGSCLLAGVSAASRKGWRYLSALPVVFTTLHLSYGSGFVAALILPLRPRGNGGRRQDDGRSLLILDDIECRSDSSGVTSDDPFLRALEPLAARFPRTVLCARLLPDHGGATQPLLGNMELRPLPYGDLPSLCTRPWLWPRLLSYTRSVMAEAGVFWLSWPHPVSLLLLVLARRRRLPCILVVRQDVQRSVTLRYRGLSSLAARGVVRLMDWLLRFWRNRVLVLVVGDALRDRYLGRVARVGRVCFPVPLEDPGATRALAAGTIPAGPLRLLFVGRLEPEKGLPYLLRAVAILKREGRQVRLDLIGRGTEESSLRRLARDIGIDDWVRLPGFIPHGRELGRRYREADVFVLPSLCEGLPSVLFEAVAFDVPIVATRVGSVEDVVHDGLTGLLVPPGNPAALARAIARVADDREGADRMARAAKDRTGPHAFRVEQDRLMQLVDSYLEETSHERNASAHRQRVDETA